MSIPIIIHLFNFRVHKTVYFSNVKFLRNLEQETKAKSKLKELLILLARILAVASLVVAFAQPVIVDNSKTIAPKNAIGIYLDNSFSTNSETKAGKVIEVAKNKAISIVEAGEPTTQYLFLTNDFLGKHQHLYNREIVQDFVNETQTSSSLQKISTVYEKMNDYLKNDGETQKIFYLISDFQKITTDFENLPKDSSTQIFLLPVFANQTNNIYIDSLYFETPYRSYGKEDKLFVKIKNTSEESYQDMPIKLYINDSLKTIGSYNLEPKQEQTVELVYTNTQKGFVNGRVEITDYPVVYDNTFYFAYQIAEKTKILLINGKNTDNIFLKSFFAENPNFDIETRSEDNIPISQIASYNLVILSELATYSNGLTNELKNYAENGGTLIFIPSKNAEVSELNNFLITSQLSAVSKLDTANTKIAKINELHLIYKNTFKNIAPNTELPLVKEHFVFQSSAKSNEETLLNSENGHKLLTVAKIGKGQAYIFAMPLNQTNGNFVTHPLISPTIYNIAIYSQLSDKIYYTVNKDRNINLSNFTGNPEFLKIGKLDGSYDFIPQTTKTGRSVKINLDNNKIEAGSYFIFSENEKVKNIAFNYEREESDLEFYTEKEIEKQIKKYGLNNTKIISIENKFLKKAISENTGGKKLWKMFITLALFFLALEIIFIRLLK